MKTPIKVSTLPEAPAITRISKKARISVFHAKVVAELNGIPIDSWEFLGAVAVRVLNHSVEGGAYEGA